MSSPLRSPVRASSSTARRTNGSSSASGGAQQLGGRGVVDEPRQRLVGYRQVTGEDQRSGWGIVVAPLGDAFEEAAQRQQLGPDGVAVQLAAAAAGTLSEPELVGLDVAPADVCHGGDLRRLAGQKRRQLPERPFGVGDRRGAQAELDLGEITRGCDGHGGRHGGPLGRAGAAAVGPPQPRGDVGDAGVEQRGAQPHQGGAQLVAGLGMAATGERVEQGGGAALELGRGHRAGCHAGQGGELRQRRPLRVDPGLVRPQHPGGPGDPGVQVGVVVAGRDSQTQFGSGQILG